MSNLANHRRRSANQGAPDPAFARALIWVWLAGYGTAALLLASVFGLGRIMDLREGPLTGNANSPALSLMD